jgi:serine/threonine-protein kinase
MLYGTLVRLGDSLGQYRILDVVGHGGMAAVYVAEHNVVQHRVAIKVVHPRHLDNPRMTQRFLNEARAVAAIRHPGIVEFYDFGRADDGRAYIVMELLTGETLQARLVDGPIPVSHALAFGRQMASALRAAHDRAIVHRDLKPANVFLVPDPDVPFGERAKILDFGIAKRTEDREEITGTGMLIGTPAHMSPEQCRGDKDIDGRADVYALGVLLYHMVTGKLPYDGEGTGEIVSRHLYEEIPRATRVNPDVPAKVSEVISKCMAKDRGRRFQSMEELMGALVDLGDAVVPGVPVMPRLPQRFATGSRPPEPAENWRHTLAHLPNVSNTPTNPWPAKHSTGQTTLTRTIVDPQETRARDRRPALLLSAAAGVVLIAAIVVGMLVVRGMPADGKPERAMPTASVLPLPPPRVAPRPQAEKPAPTPRPKARDKQVKDRQDRDDKPKSKPSRKETRTRPNPPPAKQAAPAPKEDPFATVSTPAVF